MQQQENNKVSIIGTISEPFVLSHTLYNEYFDTEIYTASLDIRRFSGCVDRIPIELKGTRNLSQLFKVGTQVLIEGEIRTYNIENHLKIIIFVNRITKVSSEQDKNEIEMKGYICRQPVFRTTPFGRKICDVLIAIPRNYKKSSYIPCILWGRNAEYVADLGIGTRLILEGRIQSRDYIKKIDDKAVNKIAIEVSCNMVGII